MSQTRQLAAIMFTDIVGFTTLMGNDETKAFELLKKNRELQKPIIEQFNGRWIKELGDGVMASFNTVSDAVNAAIKIQEACAVSSDFLLRIGIHLGEVVFENEDVFGDGVNIASRIVSLAEPGGIYVSGKIYAEIKNQKSIESVFLGMYDLKNVASSVEIFAISNPGIAIPHKEKLKTKIKVVPVRKTSSGRIVVLVGVVILALVLTGLYYFRYSSGAGKSAEAKSIAVLPFVNMSNDPQQEYFSDGLSEELINMFTKISGLEVIGRTSSFAFKGKNEDLRTIGEKLGVDYLLEGSVRKSGDKIRITAQLIKAKEGTHLWSETYDKVLNNIFEVQDQISASVTNALRVTLLEQDKPKRQTKINPEAYNDFLRGKFYYEFIQDSTGNDKARACFKEAIRKDSTFSLPWTYLSMVEWRTINSPIDKKFNEAKQLAIKALELDPTSGIAAVNVAEFLDGEYNFQGASEKIELALKLDPENSYVLRNVGRHYTLLGRQEESIAFCKRAIEKDPEQTTGHYYLVLAYYFAERYKEAYDLQEKIQDRIWWDFDLIIRFNTEEESRKKFESETDKGIQFTGFTLLYFKSGKMKEARESLAKMIEQFPYAHYNIALLFSIIGESDKAIDWLEKAYISKKQALAYVNVDPAFKKLHDNIRFQKIIQRMNFPK